jgi:ankyrin repeat protein
MQKSLPLALQFVWLLFSLLSLNSNAQAPAMVAAKSPLPIHTAAAEGDRASVERLLRENPALRDLATDYGSTPLHLAAMNADPGPLQTLLAAKANVHARDVDGATPLHMAAFATRTRNAQLLLEAGADPTLKTNVGRDVLSMARKVRADELAGVVSLWVLKGCKATKPC